MIYGFRALTNGALDAPSKKAS